MTTISDEFGIRRNLTAVIFITAVIVFSIQTFACFSKLAIPVAAEFGNARMPYSDAMDPWLKGALGYYFNDTPANNLYRPTVGLFFSSILTFSHSVAAIPLSFVAAFLGGAVWLFYNSASWLRNVLTAGMGSLVLNYPTAIATVSPECITLDFWAQSFCLGGLLLIGLSSRVRKEPWWFCPAGFLLLGLVAAIRGPQLAGALLILGWRSFHWLRTRQFLVMALSGLALATPSICDGMIRSRHAVTNNAVAAIYCIYTDSTRNWTPESHRRYLEEKPPATAVLTRFIAFLRTPDGQAMMATGRLYIYDHTALLFASPALLAFSALFGILAFGSAGIAHALRASLRHWLRPPTPRQWIVGLGHFGSLTAVGAMVLGFSLPLAHPLPLLVGSVLIGSIAARKPIAASFALCYAGSLVLHSTLSITGGYRVSMTYEICALIALVCFWFEPETESHPEPRLRHYRLFCTGVAVSLLFGYLGNFFSDRGLRQRLRAQLTPPQTVMKVSSDQGLDRSLYINRDLIYFYTRFDPAPFGTVRTYHKLEAPGGLYIYSLTKPCSVVWADDKPGLSP